MIDSWEWLAIGTLIPLLSSPLSSLQILATNDVISARLQPHYGRRGASSVLRVYDPQWEVLTCHKTTVSLNPRVKLNHRVLFMGSKDIILTLCVWQCFRLMFSLNMSETNNRCLTPTLSDNHMKAILLIHLQWAPSHRHNITSTHWDVLTLFEPVSLTQSRRAC